MYYTVCNITCRTRISLYIRILWLYLLRLCTLIFFYWYNIRTMPRYAYYCIGYSIAVQTVKLFICYYIIIAMSTSIILCCLLFNNYTHIWYITSYIRIVCSAAALKLKYMYIYAYIMTVWSLWLSVSSVNRRCM